ncbi:Catalyzes the formation of N(4)-acetylcytidine (ac(4)C) at the wobble position of tRNA(Met) [Vibrio sp. B1REV9]|uniref:tRNA(Met) cytidine acetyltransferase TmcA n=1 Tax=Vibrio sp. B1REV9 TaxID=2751179 RepID=UPI001AF9F6A7|nr:GNAT family N-acetyltransferase [Vibrio sp. B1REV9]CAE6935903.1 Catalyzes the formation of N(4)-acetylcytidine (ac(4)C) at the wobble position of tRNA(Met) [Vibrio sp. B1REV9]
MHIHSQFLSQIQTQSQLAFQRTGVVVYGDTSWQNTLIADFYHSQTKQTWFCVGEWSLDNAHCVLAKQGHRLLGLECDVLLFDARKDFDANSFTAALGALVGGGILIVVADKAKRNNAAEQWMQTQWQKLVVIEQNKPLPELPELSIADKNARFSEQSDAIELIEKVVTGHRKRPLVLTADRGRGKSSALGIASAQLMLDKPLRILLTAPSINAVEPVFQHALRLLSEAQRLRKDRLDFGLGYIQFIAPDELLSSLPTCDLLLVDEAAAIPVPMLKQITEHYHRLVFASTVHGYEGCGRGFTLKFVEWLNKQRPGMKICHLKQPIRWGNQDNLEAWLYDAFVLNTDLVGIDSIELGNVTLIKLDKSELISKPSVLKSCFSLLVNAHYQTSPNDLLHLLQDTSSDVYIAQHNNDIVGVLLTVEEGALDDGVIQDVQLGKRRPRGHLTPVTIASQLGFPHIAKLSSLRIMRIAVHPSVQGQGIGQKILEQLHQSVASHISYLSTSFGATTELVQFWGEAGFQSIRLGTMRDAASGSYSLLMVRPCGINAQPWIGELQSLFEEMLSLSVSHVYPKLEPSLLRTLLQQVSVPRPFNLAKLELIKCYSQGGSSYESVSLWIQQWLLNNGMIGVSDFVVSKVFLNLSWNECAMQYGFTGRKQIEAQLRKELQTLIGQFTV